MELNQSEDRNPLSPLYGLRNEFLIIGLTGRLGSGCSTVASLLAKKSFDDCEFPAPTFSTSISNEERKYKIVHHYLKSNWKPYTLIRASDLIALLVLKEGLCSFNKFLLKTYNDKGSEIAEIIESIRPDFEMLSIKARDIIDDNCCFNEKKNLDIYNIFFNDNKIESFNNRLKKEFVKLKITNGSNPFQHFGDNLRKTGNPFKNEVFEPQNCYIISNLIRQLIKIVRKENKGSGGKIDKGTRI